MLLSRRCMEGPTPDQEAVLASTARLRVVRAAPGSGKTWLVSEAIRRELDAWPTKTGGIAAISFTNVGTEEILRALGRPLPHPHFLGTIDAFLFRYVVRPHLRAVVPGADAPDLIPPDWRPGEFWTLSAFDNGRVNPYDCVWSGRDAGGRPILALKNRYNGRVTPLAPELANSVRAFKGNRLRNDGCLTLADAILYATVLLRHATLGPLVRAEVARRFPLLVIDELQDTGEFHAESIHALLEEPKVRGLLVGDPDQAIYEFTGADPKKFETFVAHPGATVFDLSTTMRCPESVVRVAQHLRRSSVPLIPAAGRTGRVFLVAYDDMAQDVAAIASAFRRRYPTGAVKIVARWNHTVENLTGCTARDVPALRCRPATLLHRAVQHFRAGRTITALTAARTAVLLPILEGEGFTDQLLREHGVDPAGVKALAIQCLLTANALRTTQTAHAWETEAHRILTERVQEYCAKTGLPLRKAFNAPQRCKGHDSVVALSIPDAGAIASGIGGVPVFTIHGVKGETHESTLLVVAPVPVRRAAKDCPSIAWWPNGGADDEERRVAYVALTRTCRDLVVCVDKGVYSRLVDRRPEFVACFEAYTTEEIVAAIGV